MAESDKDLTIEELNKKVRELEVNELKIKNRTYRLSILIPVLTIVISTTASFWVAKYRVQAEKETFNKSTILRILEEDDLHVAKKKLKFLFDSHLLQEDSALIITASEKYLIDERNAFKLYRQATDSIRKSYVDKLKGLQKIRILEDAISLLSTAILINPYHADSYQERGLALFNSSKYEEALPDFKRAIELDTSNGFNYYLRGKTFYYLDKNKKEEVCNYFKKADSLGYNLKKEKEKNKNKEIIKECNCIDLLMKINS